MGVDYFGPLHIRRNDDVAPAGDGLVDQLRVGFQVHDGVEQAADAVGELVEGAHHHHLVQDGIAQPHRPLVQGRDAVDARQCQLGRLHQPLQPRPNRRGVRPASARGGCAQSSGH